MKKHIDGIIVVEGKSDVAFLSNYIDAEYVTTNGSEIPFSTLEYLKTARKNKDIIVLTDPDFPGRRIRAMLDENIDGLKHVYINKEHAIKHNKVGVAEADINEIMKALDNAFDNSNNDNEYISYSDLFNLGLIGGKDSKAKRDILTHKLFIGFSNAKTLYKKLNSLKMSKEDVEGLIYE